MTLKLFRNAVIFTPRDSGRPAAGKMQGELVRLDHGAILVENGLILKIGPEDEVFRNLPPGIHQETDS